MYQVLVGSPYPHLPKSSLDDENADVRQVSAEQSLLEESSSDSSGEKKVARPRRQRTKTQPQTMHDSDSEFGPEGTSKAKTNRQNPPRGLQQINPRKNSTKRRTWRTQKDTQAMTRSKDQKLLVSHHQHKLENAGEQDLHISRYVAVLRSWRSHVSFDEYLHGDRLQNSA